MKRRVQCDRSDWYCTGSKMPRSVCDRRYSGSRMRRLAAAILIPTRCAVRQRDWCERRHVTAKTQTPLSLASICCVVLLYNTLCVTSCMNKSTANRKSRVWAYNSAECQLRHVVADLSDRRVMQASDRRRGVVFPARRRALFIGNATRQSAVAAAGLVTTCATSTVVTKR